MIKPFIEDEVPNRRRTIRHDARNSEQFASGIRNAMLREFSNRGYAVPENAVTARGEEDGKWSMAIHPSLQNTPAGTWLCDELDKSRNLTREEDGTSLFYVASHAEGLFKAVNYILPPDRKMSTSNYIKGVGHDQAAGRNGAPTR